MARAVRRGPWVAVAAVVVLAAGCGSTVEPGALRGTSNGGLSVPNSAVSGGGSSRAGGGLGTGGGGAGGSGGLESTPGGSGASTAGSGAQAGRRGATGASNAAPGSNGSSAAGSSGPGVTATTINIGAAYAGQEVSSADSGLGAAGISPGDQKAQQNAIIDYINTHGGVAHRKLNPIYYELNPNQNAQQSFQQACSHWTTDNKVYVLQPQASALLDQCAANAHALAVDTGAVAEGTTAQDRQFPVDVVISAPTIDRSMLVTVNGLERQNYFGAGTKVGIATWDDPSYRYGIGHAALPALARDGQHNVPVAYITVPQNDSDLGSTSASINSAVLKFHEQGINHVLLFDGPAGINGAGTLVLLWMRDAQSQHYTPRYGLNSTSGFSTLAPDLPQSQQIGALGVGWFPSLDLTASDYPPSKLPDSGKLCLRVMAKAGQKANNSNERSSELTFCEFYFFLQHVLDRVQGPLTQQSGLAAIDGTGSSFQPIATFATHFSASQHDGMQLVKNVSYYRSCNCYRYTSPAYHAG